MKAFLTGLLMLVLLCMLPMAAEAHSSVDTPTSSGKIAYQLSDKLLQLMKPLVPPVSEENTSQQEQEYSTNEGQLIFKPGLLAGLGIKDSINLPDLSGGLKPTIPGVAVNEITEIRLVDDRLYIQSTGSVNPQSFYLPNPQRLVIDIPHSKLDSGLISPSGEPIGEIAVSHKWIQKIRYSLFQSNPSTVRIVLDLNTKVQANPQISLKGDQHIFQLSEVKYVVVVDAGHGGHDPGAVSITGKYEKDFNLSMTRKVVQLLGNDSSIQVEFTRLSDHFVPLDDRVAFAEARKADLFVSIHGNSFAPDRSGTETYYYNANSYSFANVMHAQVLNATGFKDGKIRKEKFRVISGTTMPAVLLEIGYLSNAKEEAELYTEAFQNRVAEAIVSGIRQYLNSK